jgi:hypothetical protein
MYQKSKSWSLIEYNGDKYFVINDYLNKYLNGESKSIGLYHYTTGIDHHYSGLDKSRINILDVPLESISKLPRSYIRLKTFDSDVIYLANRYPYDQDKYTITDPDTIESIGNVYRSEIEYYIYPKHVALNIKGGMKNRIYLGAINDITRRVDNRIKGTDFGVKCGPVVTKVTPYYPSSRSNRMAVNCRLDSVLLVDSVEQYEALVKQYGHYERVIMDSELSESITRQSREVNRMINPFSIIQRMTGMV